MQVGVPSLALRCARPPLHPHPRAHPERQAVWGLWGFLSELHYWLWGPQEGLGHQGACVGPQAAWLRLPAGALDISPFALCMGTAKRRHFQHSVCFRPPK